MWMQNFLDQYILVELTDFCNYNCIMCCHDRPEGPHSSKQGFMDKKLFKKIIKELPEMNAACGLKLFWLGEPFLNPVFADMLKECNNILNSENKGNYYIDLHTNAYFLSDEIIELLLEYSQRIPRITLSLDAVKPDTYKKIRRGGDLNRAVENIENFLKKRAALKKKKPGLIFQFIVMEENKDEALEFKKSWLKKLQKYSTGSKAKYLNKITGLSGYSLGRKIGKKINITPPDDVIWFKRLDTDRIFEAQKIYMDTMEKFNLKSEVLEEAEIIVSSFNLWNPEQDKQKNEEKDKTIRRPCSGLWKTPSIKWDGSLTVCCFDPSMELALGNLKDYTFSDLWFGDKLTEMRKNHLNGDFDKVLTHNGDKKCLNCSGLDTPYISEEELNIYKRELES
ncbi:MAG: radical SAM/SPASM domain-containing protein [Candidatus Muiribacteriota bacterium]